MKDIVKLRGQRKDKLTNELESIVRYSGITWDTRGKYLNSISTNIEWYGYSDKVNSMEVVYHVRDGETLGPRLIKGLSKFCSIHKLMLIEFSISKEYICELRLKFRKY